MFARRKLGLRRIEMRVALGSIALAAVLALAVPPASSAAAASAPPGFFGVSSNATTPSDFPRMAAAGIGVYRTGLSLPAVKRSPHQPYDWRRLDGLVAETARNGIDLLPVLYGVPPWISQERSATPLRGASAREWHDMLVAATRRYGPGGTFWLLNPLVPRRPIRVWQVWNEPNAMTWWGPRPSPRQYATLLRRSQAALHSVDPSAQILTAGVVANPTNPNSVQGTRFLHRVFTRPRMAGVADAVGYHPYSPAARGVVKQLAAARLSLRGTAGASLPIWMTELGWGTKGPREHPLIKSRRGQARSMRKAFGLILERRGRLGIARALWYHWRDSSDDLCLWCESSGLLDTRSQPKPLLDVFRRIAAS